MKRLYVIIATLLLVLPLGVKADDYFTAKESVNKTGEYQHSVFVAGNSATSNAKVDGIVFLAGNTANVKGNSEYAFVAGNMVNVSSAIEKDLFVAGNAVELDKETTIGRDLYVAGNTISILGNVEGNAFIGGSYVTLDGATINGNLEIDADVLHITNEVNVLGKLKINNTAKVMEDDGAKLIYSEKEEVASTASSLTTKSKIIATVLNIASFIVLGVVLALVFKRHSENLDLEVEAGRIGKYLLSGLGVLILLPLVAVLIMITEVGIYVSLVLIFAYIIAIFVAIVLGMTFIGHLIYSKLFKQDRNIYLAILIGVIVCQLVSKVPYVGWLVSLFVLLYGLGMIWNTFTRRND